MIGAGFLAGALAVCGCSSEPSQMGDVSGSVAKADAGSAASASRIPDDVLLSHGLESVWFDAPRAEDNGVHLAELQGNGLFLSSLAKGKTTGYLRLVERGNGHTAWYFDIESPLKNPPSIFTYTGTTSSAMNEVYFSQLDTVYCVDLRFGDLLWKQQVDFPIATRVVADDERFYVGSDNRRVFGLRKKSKVEDWTYLTGDAVRTAPLIQPPNLYVGSTDGSVYKFAGPTGWLAGTSWRFKTGARIVADPVAASRWVLVASTDYKLYCLETSDGGLYWSFPAEAPIEEAPVVLSHRTNQDFVYCVTVDRTGGGETRTLFCVKLQNGTEVWRARGIRRVVGIGKNQVYAISDSKTRAERSLVAIDFTNGKEKFRIPIPGYDFVPTNNSARDRGRIYLVAEDGTIQVIGERL